VHIPFATSERSTVGIEWELALVDADSGDLRQVARTVLDAVAPADDYWNRAFGAAQPLAATVEEVAAFFAEGAERLTR